MGLVVDASIAAAWILPDEYNAQSNAALLKLDETVAFIPGLFWSEALNLCLLAEKRIRIATGGALTAMQRLRRLNLEVRAVEGDHQILSLALKHGLTAYDTIYLALAIDHHSPLATNDRKLAAAARAERVEILGPLGDKLQPVVPSRQGHDPE